MLHKDKLPEAREIDTLLHHLRKAEVKELNLQNKDTKQNQVLSYLKSDLKEKRKEYKNTLATYFPDFKADQVEINGELFSNLLDLSYKVEQQAAAYKKYSGTTGTLRAFFTGQLRRGQMGKDARELEQVHLTLDGDATDIRKLAYAVAKRSGEIKHHLAKATATAEHSQEKDRKKRDKKIQNDMKRDYEAFADNQKDQLPVVHQKATDKEKNASSLWRVFGYLKGIICKPTSLKEKDDKKLRKVSASLLSSPSSPTPSDFENAAVAGCLAKHMMRKK